MATTSKREARDDLFGRLFWLVAAGLLLALALLPTGWATHGWSGLGASALALGVCFFGALAAFCVSAAMQGPTRAMVSLLLGMSLRMGVPLASALVVEIRGGPLAGAGFVYYLLLSYLVMLGVETVLSLPRRGVPSNSGMQ